MTPLSRKLKVLTVVGTRPDVIKLAPVVREIAGRTAFEQRLVLTAQHRHLAAEPLALFGLQPDRDLDLMEAEQTLGGLGSRLLQGMESLLVEEHPDLVLVQGDTSTALLAALASHYHGVPVGHVEAGLRTHRRDQPFPEEMNRRLLADLSSFHFAPTARARENLLAEGIAETRIYVTGNTIVDALQFLLESGRAVSPIEVPDGVRLAVLTCHRREIFGEPMRRVLEAVGRLAERPDLLVVFPVHPNPSVQRVAREVLAGRERVRLLEPLSYDRFIGLLARADLVLSDSGGVQEEAPSLGVPVVVLRETTERQEGIDAGCAVLAGTQPDRIVAAATRLLEEPRIGSTARPNPYGDGKAATRIADILEFHSGAFVHAGK
ncbi:MAG: UDP-N-acetylglucosamine 2-epimerase (non-hydrolyzing) [Planctomycetota bacterium]